MRPRTFLAAGIFTLSTLALPALGPVHAPWHAVAAHAQEYVTVDSLAITTSIGTIRIPTLVAEGSSVPPAEIQALLTSSDWSSIAAKISSISATRWRVPEIIFEQKMGQLNQTVTYRDLVLEEIANGRITRMNIAGADIDSVLPDGQKMTGRMGAMSATGVNLAAAFQVFMSTSSDPNAPLIPLYDSFAADGYEITFGDAGQVKVGVIAGRNFSMRPLSTSFSDLMDKLAAMQPATPGAELTPEQQAKALEAMPAFFDMYRAYAIGEVEVRDMTFSMTKPEAVSFSIGNILMKDFANARLGEMTVSGVSMSKAGTDNGTFALGKFTMKGLDFGALLDDLQKVMTAMSPAQTTDPSVPPPAFSPTDFHIPRFDEIAIEGLDFDGTIKNDPADPTKLQHLKMSLGKAAITVRKWSNLMPISFSSTVENLFMQPDPADPSFAQMRAAGVDKIDMSYSVSVDYDETAQRLTLEDLGFDMASIGKFNIKGTIEGIAPETFSGDPAAAQMAMATAMVKSLEIEMTDSGALALGLARQSADTGMPAEQLREQMAAMPLAALPQVLGQSQKVMDLANALSTFVKSGGTLKIVASSLAGVGMLDMADIPGIMNKTEITATVSP